MRKILFIIPLLLLPELGLSHENKFPTFYIHTGLTKLAAPKNFSDFWTSGVNVGLGIGKPLSQRIELMATIFYNYSTIDRSGVENSLEDTEDDVAVDGDPASILNGFVRAQLNFFNQANQKTLSYLYGAAGFHRLLERKVTIMYQDHETHYSYHTTNSFGVEFGFGVDFQIEGTVLFIELGANIGFTKPEKTVILPLKFGIRI